MSLYGGIDLHANNSVIVVINEHDEVIYRKRLPNALPTILEQLSPYHTEMQGLVVESTYNWYWLVDGLMEADYRVHLATPAAIQQYSGRSIPMIIPMRVGWPTCYAWRSCQKGISIPRPNGRYA